MQPSFSFWSFVPDFENVFSQWSEGSFSLNDSTSLSAFFVIVLLASFSIGLVVSFFSYLKARRRIRFYHKILLGDAEVDKLHEQMHDINHKALSSQAHKHLWREFTETLVEVDTGDTSQYHNTYDAEHFFNTTSLCRGSSESRLVVAVPSFLTAIGVLGTFVGLQMGLASLDLAQNASVDELRSGIGNMISGAAVAFTTSVWGVLLSLVFNFTEKATDWNIRSHLFELQNRVDQLFPRITPEYQLVKIANDGSESREALQGLADKIGDKMQETLEGVTDSIQVSLEKSLESIMKPAIDKLVDVGTDTSSSALDNMLGQFMDSMGKEGNRQREVMDEASQQMLGTLKELGTTLSAFMNRLEQQESDAALRQSQLSDSMGTQLEKMAQSSSEHVTLLTKNSEEAQKEMTSQVQSVVSGLTEQQTDNQKQFNERMQQLVQHSDDTSEKISTATTNATNELTDSVKQIVGELRQAQSKQNGELQEQSKSLLDGTEALLDQVNTLLQEQTKAVANLLGQGEILQHGIEKSANANSQAATKTLEASENMHKVSQNINVFGSSMHDAANGLSGTITQAVDATRDLATQNQSSADKIESLRDDIAVQQQRFNDTREAVDQTLSTADRIFVDMREHQQDYLAGLNGNVEELVDKLNKLLSQYAKEVETQTSERMGQWNTQTSAYTTQMTSAIEALAGAVDEIETKVQSVV